ncbi:MAG: flagellar export protein FliJ [Eubacteriales bacterium]|nr:flagellar export protein FliJ [Lachnospiraceae bacterium]MDO5127822.1 flagellar export protein FliJ [Eubacteriales bacterium]
MAKFQYRMQNILNIKYKLEDTAKSEFAAAMHNLRMEEEQLSKLEERKYSYEMSYENAIMGALDFLKIEECANAVDIMKIKISEQEERVRARSKELEHARKKLNEVIQERKMHEILRDKQFEVFLQELNLQEVKEIDEVVSYQYGQGNTSVEE